MAGKPKASFYFALFVVVVALIGFAVYRADIFAPKGDGGEGGDLAQNGDLPPIQPPDMTQVEDPNTAGILTTEEYEIVPQEMLTAVQGASDYQELGDDKTVRFALNVWAGWAPIIYANGGGRPGKVWTTPDGEEFKVELRLIDNPTTMLDSYVAGDVHIGWATVDMLPLFMERLVDGSGNPIDSRVMPRIFQQVDWSAGGDGIVVRTNINEASSLRGQSLALAQNSPSHYFALNMLVSAGVQPHEVEFKFTGDAFEAAALYAAQRDIAACVSWAPDIYKLADSQGNKMLVDTTTANRLIADVWFARADFARDHPGMIEALVRGIFDAMDELKTEAAKDQCAELMSNLYNIPAEETRGMFQDAYSTGWGDNYQFFLNKNYLANFERVWNNAYYLYGRIRVIRKPKVTFEKVVDFTYIKKLGEEEKYKNQKVETATFAYRQIDESEVAEKSFLTATHYIHFFPNSDELHRKIIRRNDEGEEVEELYDPNVDNVLERIGEQIGQFERSRIVIEGHTDATMRGQVDEELVLDLSKDRAEAVKDALVSRFEQLDENRFYTTGVGWRRPADSSQPDNHAKNRRVEIRILPAEGV